MNRLEQKIKRLEDSFPQRPCKHPLALLVNPTEKEEQELKKQLEACLNCKPSGPGPNMVVIRFEQKGLQD